MNQRFNAFLKWVVGEKSYSTHMNELSNRMGIMLNLIAILISIVYVFADINQGVFQPLIAHFFLLSGCILGLVLLRRGLFFLAKILVLSLCTLAIYMAVAAETYETASHLYFFTITIASFVVFDYKRLKVSIAFALFSFVLYIVATRFDFSILPAFNFSSQATRTFFILNVTVFTLSTTVIIALYIKAIHNRNHKIQDQNIQLKKSNNELDQFVYSTSHDLKAPLASVMGLLNVMEMTSDEIEKQKYHDLIRDRIGKMDLFIRDIIDLIKNTRMPVQNENLNLSDLMEKIYKDLTFQSGEAGIQYKNEIPKQMRIKTDRVRITTLFSNLLSNAIKYIDPQKEQNIVSVQANETDMGVVIKVKDNGIGIGKDQLSDIFKMFYRANSSAQGAGLGLYIANETAEKLGGEIVVESELNLGTSFSLTLPWEN